MLEGKAVIVETDMLQNMQQDALDLASKALDFFDVTEATEIGRFIKKVANQYWNSFKYDKHGSNSKPISPSIGYVNSVASYVLIELYVFKFLQKFDSTYGTGWQCIVGTDFGSFVTHCHGCFIYFCIGSLAVLLFKGSAGPDQAEANHCASLDAVKAWC